FALRREGLGACWVVNRTRENAEELAARFDATAHGLDELDVLLAETDIVLSCIEVSDFVLDSDRISRALKHRRRRPIFLVDIGVPRNIDPEVDRLDSVYLYNIDDLQEVAESNEAERRRESQEAERIVLEEQERFAGWMVALQAVPTIRHLRARAESIRDGELDRMLSRMDLTGEQREAVDALTRSIVNKLLHSPLTRLNAQTDRDEGLAVLEEARALFALDDADAPGGQVDEGELGQAAWDGTPGLSEPWDTDDSE
ncbi:MAG: glutamyl-tRNA reductase, partial [Myxococcota bacterium]